MLCCMKLKLTSWLGTKTATSCKFSTLGRSLCFFCKDKEGTYNCKTGNNENEAALRQNWYQTDSLFETYKWVLEWSKPLLYCSKNFPFPKRRLHNPLCGHCEEDSRPRGSFKIFHCVKVWTKALFSDKVHFHSSVLQTVWLVKKPATLQTIHKAASGVTPTIMTTSDSEIHLKIKKILTTTCDKSGPTTGNGKTIQKQDLHQNMVSRPSQLSQY